MSKNEEETKEIKFQKVRFKNPEVMGEPLNFDADSFSMDLDGYCFIKEDGELDLHDSIYKIKEELLSLVNLWKQKEGFTKSMVVGAVHRFLVEIVKKHNIEINVLDFGTESYLRILDYKLSSAGFSFIVKTKREDFPEEKELGDEES